MADTVAPLSQQTESFHSPHETGCPTTSLQQLGLAILGLACPDLDADQSLNLNTYKSHTLKQYRAQCYTGQTHIHNLFLHFMLNMSAIQQLKTHIHTIFKFHTSELKRPAGPASFCRAQCFQFVGKVRTVCDGVNLKNKHTCPEGSYVFL